MKASIFWRTTISGFIATFVMAMIGFMQGGFGLPVIDVGHILTESFNHALLTHPYHIIYGNMAYNIMGIILALIYVAFLQERMPGNWLVQGVIYGFIISILASLLVSPFVSMAAGQSVGLFYTETWVPGLMILAALFMHLGYGITLMLCLKVAGVKGMNAEV